MKKDRGRLIMASHSIGESQDIPARSLDAVRTSDLLIFEEDRGARNALKAAGIHRDYLRYSEHDETQSLETLAETLRAGKTAVYMSDQGCPGLADPGRNLVRVAVAEKAEIRTIPGPSSLTAAIAVCPFDLGEFHFGGFPPRDQEAREKKLAEWANGGVPVVIMDTPYRLGALLDSCCTVFGVDHQATLALDLSGEAETILNGPLGRLVDETKTLGKLNFVLIVDAIRSKRSTNISLGPPFDARVNASRKPAMRSPGKSRRR